MVKHFWKLWDQMNFAFVMNSLSLSLSLSLERGGGGKSQQLNKLREQKAMWENGRERKRGKLFKCSPHPKAPFWKGNEEMGP